MKGKVFEFISCPLCGNDEYREVLTTYDRFDRQRRLKFFIVECKECGLRYLNPRIKEEFIGNFYRDTEYDPFISTTGRNDLQSLLYRGFRKLNLGFKYNVVRGLKLRGRLLDIGCATGEFLEVMRKAGWKVVGVEPDRVSREFVVKKGIRVYRALEELQGDSQFDIITMWHSLEHIYGLRSSVESISRLSKVGGYVVVAVPNVDSYGLRVYREHWVALDAPRHVYHFDFGTLVRLFDSYEVELIRTRILLLDTFYNHVKSFFLKNENMLNFYYLICTVSKELIKTCVVSQKNISTLVCVFRKRG